MNAWRIHLPDIASTSHRVMYRYWGPVGLWIIMERARNSGSRTTSYIPSVYGMPTASYIGSPVESFMYIIKSSS